MPFKMHKIIFFPEFFFFFFNMCTYLKYSDLLPETHLFFYLAKSEVHKDPANKLLVLYAYL